MEFVYIGIVVLIIAGAGYLFKKGSKGAGCCGCNCNPCTCNPCNCGK